MARYTVPPWTPRLAADAGAEVACAADVGVQVR